MIRKQHIFDPLKQRLALRIEKSLRWGCQTTLHRGGAAGPSSTRRSQRRCGSRQSGSSGSEWPPARLPARFETSLYSGRPRSPQPPRKRCVHPNREERADRRRQRGRHGRLTELVALAFLDPENQPHVGVDGVPRRHVEPLARTQPAVHAESERNSLLCVLGRRE